MGKISESDANQIARSLPTASTEDHPWMLDTLTRYQQQQQDAGEPEWPSQVQAAQDAQNRVRAMYAGGIDKVPFEVSPWSQDPALDKATVANQAFLAHAYNKPLQEIADRPDFYRNDYARQFFGQPGGVDEKTFFGLASKQIEKQKSIEDAFLLGRKAALRGDEFIPSWQDYNEQNTPEDALSKAWQAGFYKTQPTSEPYQDIADELLNAFEVKTGKAKELKGHDDLLKSEAAGGGGLFVDPENLTPAQRESLSGMLANRVIDGVMQRMASLKPVERKRVYDIMEAKSEAAGNPPNSLFVQMMNRIGGGLTRMRNNLETQAGIVADLMGGAPSEGDASGGDFIRNAADVSGVGDSISQRQNLNLIQAEVRNRAAGIVDPFTPRHGWIPDIVEKGLVESPGAVFPAMAITGAAGLLGGTAILTADFAEQNRIDLVNQGLDNEQAIKIGAAAAPLQAAAESLSNAFQLGRFPAVQRALAALTKPIAGGAGLASRYVLNAGASLATEYTEEQLQDNVLVPATQELLGALQSDVPEVNWSMYRNRAVESTPELLSVLAPMALVFGGTMTAAQANLSSAVVSSQDMLEAAGYSAAQANAIRATAPDAQISKAREMWGQRAGTQQSMEAAAKSVSERMKLLQTDHAAAQADLEKRGILPRMLRAAYYKWRLTFNDGSIADFNSHQEADAARWQWATDKLGKVHLATREALAQMERGAEVGREFAVEFKPDARFATEEELKQLDFQARVKQGEVLDNPDAIYQDAVAVAKAAGDDSHAVQILGSSVNEFKDGVLRTTMRLYEGAHILTLVEEKLEGDAKAILSGPQGRAWMLQHLRAYEQASGDKLFAENDDANVTENMLVEAWSHLGQAYLVGKSSDAQAVQGKNARRMFRYILNSGLSPEMNAETQYWRSVAMRAQKLGELKQGGKLGADVTAELEKQLGIDSQAKHEDEAAKEADAIANEALYAGAQSYSEENPSPNGETFSIRHLADHFQQAGKFYRVIHGDAAFQDVVNSGLVRTNADSKVSKESSLLDRLAARPTAFPSFSKDYAAMSYAQSNANHYIVVTDDASLQPSTHGRHSKGKTYFPTSGNGEHLQSLPANKVEIYKHIGGGQYQLAFQHGAPIQQETFSVRKFTMPSLAGAAATLQGMKQGNKAIDFPAIYAAAKVGQSSHMLPLDLLYAQAVKQRPSLTTAEFGKQVQALYDSGHLMLEPGESAASMRDTLNLYGVRDSLGIPSMFSAPMPTGETFSLAKWSKSDKLSNGFLGTTGWTSFRDGIENIDPSAKNGISSRSTSAGTKDAELTSLWRSGFTASPNTKEDARGGEHVVEFRNGRAYKQTHPETFGAKFSPETPDTLTWGTPLEYLQRWRLFNEIFDGADVRFEGVVMHPNGALSLKISQPIIEGLHPGIDQIQDTLKKAGWKNTALNTWEKSTSRGELLMTDAKPENFKVADGVVVPVDVIVSMAPVNETHSLRSGDFSSRIAAAFSPFQRSPELRMTMALVAKARAQKLGAQWIEKAAEIRSAADIGKEARMREALAYDARMQEYLDGLTPEARQTLEQEPTGLENDPLIAAMLDHGRLMSRSTAKRLGKVEAKSGDYDGVPRLPASWYSKGAGIMPDQMAQAMLDAGLLKDAHTDTLWQALENRIGSHVKNKAEYDRAQDAYKAAEKYARDASRAESDKWAEGAKEKAGSPKAQREMLKAALRTLDGILSAAPPEVRAKVGGYVKLAGLATDEAMLREIENRIEKLNTELEKWLKKEGLAQVEKLLKKGRPSAESGKKAKGKDADLHHLFSAAEKASKMDAAAVAGELARLDSLIAGDTLTPEQETLATTERGLVELLGDLKNADSGRVFSAIDTLRSIYDGAWLKWKLSEIERKERRAGVKQDLITDTGKQGIKTERDAANKAAVTLLGKTKGFFLSLSSFHEVLAYCFGEKSERVKSLVDAERQASGQYEDVNQDLADEVEALFTDMAGSTLAGERLRFDMAQRTIKTAKGELSQLEAIQALLMWRQEDGRRHMEGHLDESGKPVGKWHYDQAWIDEITAALSPEARRLMGWIMQKYGAEWAALNPLYRARYGVNLPAHDNYAPITVTPAQKKKGEVVDPVTGEAMSSGSILTPGSLRTRSRSAIAEPEFRDALQTLLIHTRQLEYWKAYYDLATEANAILGNREVLNAVKAKGGEPAATALSEWVDAIAQRGFRDASASLEMNKLLSRMTGRAATVGLLGRVSTLLVQSTQLAAAVVKMPLGRYLVGMSKLLTGNLGYGDAIKSDFIQRRYKSAPPIVRQAIQALGETSKPNQVTRAARGLGQLLSGADALFTAGTYALLLDYHRGTGRALGLSGAELETHAHTEAERDTEQVAQPTRMATRSLAEITMTNPLGKSTWAYSSEARQKIALAAWAATKIKSDPAQFAKVIFLTFGVGGLMTQLLRNLWKKAKGDDDEKMWTPERLVMDMLSSPLHGIPIVGSLMNDGNMLSGVSRLKHVDFSGDPIDIMRDVDTVLSAMGMFNDTAAGVSSLSHAGLDAAKVLENLTDGK
jgi:hypothetical protein